MATRLNLDSLVIDSSGRASFSGLSSGIDIQANVNALIAAKRIPIDSIEKRISANETKIALLNDIGQLTRNLRQAADLLKGSVTFDKSGDIFQTKSTFASTTRADAKAPSAAADIIGVTATNRAPATNHQIEVQQIAKAHKLAGDQIAVGADDPLGYSGSFEINGKGFTVGATDSLFDVRDKINAANSGTDATGVTASLVSIASDKQILVLTASKTGEDAAITLADTAGGTVLQSLGLLNGDGTIKNELQAASNAKISVDGLEGIDGVSVIERQTNTIDDVIDGLTLTLFKAEVGTTIGLNVERDLNRVKSAIVDVVDAYNELRTFINTQAQSEIANEDGEVETSLLAGSRVLSEIRSRLAAAIGSTVQGQNPAMSGLTEIGISIVGNAQVSDPLLANTLKIDEAKLDDALLNRSDEVSALFGFGFASSSSDVRLTAFTSATSFNKNGYKLNVAYENGAIVSANIDGPADGSDNGSIKVDGKRLTVLTGGATGLQMLYSGDAPASGVDLKLSVGVGAQIASVAEKLLDKSTGLITGEIDVLSGQNTFSTGRMETLNERLVRERERLLERFVAMESALASMNNLLDSLKSQIEGAFGGRD